MSVLRNKEETKIILDCDCYCGEGIKIEYDKDNNEVFISVLNSNWYRDQHGIIVHIRNKLSRIWKIIIGKDYYYSELMISMGEWHEFLRDEIIHIAKDM